MILSDLRTRASEIMNDVNFTTNNQAAYTQAINDSQRVLTEMLKILHTNATQTLTASTQSYTLPTGYISLFNDSDSVLYTNSSGDINPLQWWTFEAVKKSYDDWDTKTGTPELFWIQNKSIYLYPIPDTADSIRIYYYNYPTDLSSSGDTSELPDFYKYAIIDLTCSVISKRNELYSQAKMFYDMALERCRIIDNQTDDSLTSRRSTGSEYCGVSQIGILG